ncbi:MAG: amidohydrolase family protein [Candidatus Thermoplasmatota archaeon]
MEEFEEKILDAHVHLGPSDEWLPYVEPSVETDTVIESMERHGVKKAVVFPNPCVGDRYPETNDYIAEAVEEYHDRLIGFGRVDPRRGDEAVSEVERCVNIGLDGIKLHPFVETFRPDHPNFEELFDVIYENELVLLPHTGSNFSSAGFWNSVLEDRADLNLILGHLNEGCISVVEDHENVFVDTSGTRVYMLEHAVKKIPDRIVFGSDYPYLNYEVQKTVIKAADITDEQKRKIFIDNLNGIFQG